jgi:hypothetical protein
MSCAAVDQIRQAAGMGVILKGIISAQEAQIARSRRAFRE